MPKGSQQNTAGVTSKDRSASGPRPDGGGGAMPSEETRGFVPVGGIVMYSGAFADIPANWALCDGAGGTPDLTDKFVLGTNTEADVGTSGGTAEHKHAPGGLALVAASGGTPAGAIDAAGSHSHTFNQTGNNAGVDLVAPDVTATGVAATGSTSNDGNHSHNFTGTPLADHTHTFDPAGKTDVNEDAAGSTAVADVLPPWFKLAFIQRIT